MRKEICNLIDSTDSARYTYLFRSLDKTHPALSAFLNTCHLSHSKLAARAHCEYHNHDGLCQCGEPKEFVSFNKGFRLFCNNYCEYAQQHKKMYTKRVANDPAILKKKQATALKKYGKTHHMKTKEYIKQKENQNIAKFGYKSNLQSPETKIKIQKTMFSRYNRYNASQIHYSDSALEILNNKKLFNAFIKDKTTYQAGKILNVDRNTLYRYIDLYESTYKSFPEGYGSEFEKDVAIYLESLNIKVECHNRSLLSGKEIDIYLPDLKIGIECNGEYWHSEKFNKNKMYHYNKWKYCNESNIHLISIWEHEWINQTNKVKSLLQSKVGQKEKGAYARQCYIAAIDSVAARPFVDQYHLQGFVGGSSHWGAFTQENTLIGVMTFGWTRGSVNSRRFELKRWVTDNKTHPGLMSKTFKFAQKELDFDHVVSFSDNRWFSGNSYSQCGFVKGKTLSPAYSYFVNNKLQHCSNFTKQNIRRKYPDLVTQLDQGITENEAMKMLGYYRVWDCGKTEWLWQL